MKPEEVSVDNANSSLTSMEKEEVNPSEFAIPAVPEAMTEASYGEGKEDHCTKNEESHASENAEKQIVVYDPAVNSREEFVRAPDPLAFEAPPPSAEYSFPHQTSRVSPSIGAFAVQCADCFKWRLIPTEEKYEEIRECILEIPFVCETAREWCPDISCDKEPDIEQDGSRPWAIDKPNIARPPPGWKRLLRIRAEGGTKFADVYYKSPLGKRLRSMAEVLKCLEEHPEYILLGVSLKRFSFRLPRPLMKNYVRKRPRSAPSNVQNKQELRGPDD